MYEWHTKMDLTAGFFPARWQRAAHLAEQAVQIWLRAQGIDWDRSSSIDDARLINALAEGVRHPLIRLESVAFWRLLPTHESV